MKKIFVLLMLSIVMVSCYDDYVKDFSNNAVYFSNQTDVRTFVVGEGMQIKIGVAYGGGINKVTRNVTFELNNSLITPQILATMQAGTAYIKDAVSTVTTLLPLPTTYYTLSNANTMVINAGENAGYITIKADSAKFLADAATLKANYVLPFNITKSNVDSILVPKRYMVLGLKYENMLFGNYYHGGITTVKDANGIVVKTTTYQTTIPVPESQIWKLTTVAPNSLTINGYSDQTTTKAEMMITLNGGNVTVSSVTGSTKVILPDQTSTYNQNKLLQNRKIFLNYKFVNADGTTSYAKDTLTFRNRIRDGVNEWQDENPSHY
jgi:hypothetical protein